MRMKITIRRAKLSDAIKIKNVHHASIREICSRNYSKKQISSWIKFRRLEGYRNAFTRGEELFFVAFHGQRIAGFSSLKGNCVQAVYMHPKYLERGIGSRLLKAVEKLAKRKGIKELKLGSTLTAFKFYKSHGYKVSRKSNHYLQDGTPLQCILMKKRI